MLMLCIVTRVKSSRPMWQLDTDNSTHETTRPPVTTRHGQLDPIYHCIFYFFLLCNFITFYTGKQITSNKIKPWILSYPCPFVQYNYPPPFGFGPSPVHSIPLPVLISIPYSFCTSHPYTPPISSSTLLPYSSFFPTHHSSTTHLTTNH